ncbi:MAG: hypothetical protein DRI26_08485 [Chloroflexi bacterium]|nr:MAG: hypothetical protein DRI26_08485 [Chloroflexota bacterium]
MRMWSLRGRTIKGALRLLGLGAALIILALAAGNQGQGEVSLAKHAGQRKGTALIILGRFSPDWYAGRIARNIAAEAASDFESLGYRAEILYYPDAEKTVDAICNKADIRALAIIAHGNRANSGGCVYAPSACFSPIPGEIVFYSNPGRSLPYISSFKTPGFDYVILHSCSSLNEDSYRTFAHYTNFLKGYPWYTTLLSAFLWQWLRFPSSGPHSGEYGLLDTARMVKELSAEEAAAMPLAGEFDIPDEAEDVAKEAFIRLAEAHNSVIEGYEDEARVYVQQAIELLNEAYNRGWDLAEGIADDLMQVMPRPCTITVRPGQSIQKAIDRAKEGDVICLSEGTWEENLVIGKSVTLRGAGPEKTVIRSAQRSRPVVWIEGSGIEVVLEGLTITGAWGRWLLLEQCPIGLVAKGSAKVGLKNSQVSGNGDSGLWVVDSAQVSLKNSKVSGNERGLWVGDFAWVSLTNSKVSGNGDDGLWVEDSAWANLTDSQVSGNEGFGLFVGDSAQVSLTGSKVSGNGCNGLRVGGSAKVSLQDSQVSGNWEDGLDVQDSTRVTVEGSLIEGNHDNGILVAHQAHVELTRTTIRNNTGWGIAAYLRKCGYDWDEFTGTVLWQGRGNQIYGNGKGDVCLP